MSSSGPTVGPPEPSHAGATSPPADRGQPNPTSAPALRPPSAALANASTDDRPWYRQEPWLAWLVAAFLPMVGALAVPAAPPPTIQPLRLASVGLSALCLLVAVALLIRQGPFRPALRRGAAGAGPGRR